MELPKTETSYFCPVSGLPVLMKPEWQDQKLGTDYTVSYYHVGSSILYMAPTGTINSREMRRGIEYTRDVVANCTRGAHPLVMIYDLIDLYSTTLESRRDFMRNYLNNDYICALIFCNASPLLRIGIKIGQRFITAQRPAFIADDYANAIGMAQQCSVERQLDVGSSVFGQAVTYSKVCQSLTPIEMRSSKAWHIQSGQYANESVLIDQNVLQSTSRGYLQQPDIAHIDVMRSSVLAALPEGAKIKYIIVDSRELAGADRGARRLYMQSLLEWHARHPIQMFIFIGVNTFLRAATFLAKPILKFPIEIADDLNEAYALIRKHTRRSVDESSSIAAEPEAIGVTLNDVDRLLAYIASVNWEEKGVDTKVQIDMDHPFYPVVQAIGLIKTELDDLFAESRMAEKALKKTEEKYRELFEKGSDWLCIHDLDGNLLETNFEFKTKMGWSLNTAEQINLKDLVPQRYRDGVDAYLDRIIHSGHDQGVMAMKGSDGREILLAYNNLLISDAKGRLTLVKGSARDITTEVQAAKERKVLQKKLQQAQKMESIGTLAGGIAHDFNNILSSIIGFTELAMDEAPLLTTSSNSPLEDNLKEVYTAGHRAKNLVKQIMTFARRSDEEMKPIQISLVAKEVLQLIRAAIPANIHIKQNIRSNAQVEGNTTQIHQIFMNLCTNAAHAMEDKGGLLMVDIWDIELSEEDTKSLPELLPGPHLKIVISDTGTGIAPENIELIFEPYFTTKAQGHGTGLGLATVHGIVKEYSGEIVVDSTMGAGTVFTIYFPTTTGHVGQDPEHSQGLPTGTERILFVDDESSIVKMVARMLQRLGYMETSLSDSRMALKVFSTKPDEFDLVITDLSMPHITGDDLAKEILSIRPDIPILLYTGNSEKLTAERATDIGIHALKLKPIEIHSLATTIREVLNGRC